MLAEAPGVALVDPMVPRQFRVHHVRKDTSDTATLLLEPRDGHPLAFRTGQFTMLGRPGHREVPISISGDASQPGLLQHTVRDVGDATAALVRAQPGDVVLVRGPYGRGWDVTDATDGDLLVVAGGIGLAPLRPALLEALAERPRYRRILLVYGGRGPAQLLYGDELQAWQARPDLDVQLTVDTAPGSWRGHVGLVTSVLPSDLDPTATLALVCGPEVMMRLTADVLVERGLPAERVRLSLERNMHCGVGACGHCMLREIVLCLDGPVLDYRRLAPLMTTRGL